MTDRDELAEEIRRLKALNPPERHAGEPDFENEQHEIRFLRHRLEEMTALVRSYTRAQTDPSHCSCPSCSCGTGHKACECPSPYYPRPECTNPLKVQTRKATELERRHRALLALVREIGDARHRADHSVVAHLTHSMSDCPDKLCARVSQLEG